MIAHSYQPHLIRPLSWLRTPRASS